MTAMIWLNGKSNDDFGFIVQRSSRRPALPGTVDRTLAIPGRNGAWDFGADAHVRQFVLECAFLTRDAFDLQQKAAGLAAFLVDSFGKPRTFELRFRERPGQFFRVRLVGSFDIDRIVGTGVFSLPLTAFDPWASGTEQVYETTLTTSPFVTVIQSAGEIRTAPIIVIMNQGPTTINRFKISNEYQVE